MGKWLLMIGQATRSAAPPAKAGWPCFRPWTPPGRSRGNQRRPYAKLVHVRAEVCLALSARDPGAGFSTVSRGRGSTLLRRPTSVSGARQPSRFRGGSPTRTTDVLRPVARVSPPPAVAATSSRRVSQYGATAGPGPVRSPRMLSLISRLGKRVSKCRGSPTLRVVSKGLE